MDPTRIAHTYLGAIEQDDEILPEVEIPKVRPLFSAGSHVALVHAFGVRAVAFFDFYDQLRLASAGGPAPEDGFVVQFRFVSRLVSQKLTSETTRNKFADIISQLRPLFVQFDAGRRSRALFIRAAGMYADLLTDVAADRDIYLQPTSSGTMGWPMFRVMSAPKQKLEELRRNDPETYESVLKSKQVFKEIDQNITKEVEGGGLIHGRKMILGRPVHTGKDPISEDEYVFDTDGDMLTIPEYVDKRRKVLDTQERQTRVFPTNLGDLQTMTSEEADALTMGSPIEYVSMTDDKAKTNSLTRIYPVKKMPDGKQVVVSGRYKGFVLEDLVNRSGRMIEGVAYDLDPKSNLPTPMETRGTDGRPNVRTSREPYVTVTGKGLLYLRIPNNTTYTGIRNTVSQLAKLVPSLRYEEKSRKASFTFEPQDFAAVREALGGVSLSTAAVKLLKDFFARLAHHELALSRDNLKFFETERIGGFKPGRQLYHKQKEAMAWVESRGGSGVVALDTGLGKCLVGNTLVWTNQGLVPIQDINPGNAALDDFTPVTGWSVLVNGESLPVRSFYNGGSKPTVKATLASGLTIEGSLVHPVSVRGLNGENWVQLSDLRLGDAVCVDRTEQSFAEIDPEIVVPRIEDFNTNTIEYPVPRHMTPDLARLLGYIVGEAWARGERVLNITQQNDVNPESHKDIRDTLLSTCGWKEHGEAKDQWRTIAIGSIYLRMYFEGLGIERVLAAGKTVPPIILRSTRASVQEFLRALFEGEASVTEDGTVEITSASEQLLREVQILLLGFGITGRRSPKHVKGYEHTYWRLTITGEEARLFQKHIGFISSRKVDALRIASDRLHNANLDVIPFAVSLVEAVRAEISAVVAGNGRGGGIVKRWGTPFINTMQHIRMGRRNPTYPFLRKMLTVAGEVGVSTTKACQDLQALVDRHLLYDPVVKLELGSAEVMDIEVNDPRHHFVSNGVLSHNTCTAIASMQKLVRDGALEEGQKFLYVCPAKLRGNLPKEIETFIMDPKALRDRIDIMSYAEFTGAANKDPHFASKYASVLFDEAQAMKTPGSDVSKAAMKLRHPRKVLLTASPMEKSPMEVFTLVAISNNLDLDTKEGREQIRAFRKRFAEEVGGKIIGIKNDPTVLHDFRVWVKQNLYFADKRDVEEVVLPKLKTEAVTVAMEPEIEAQYKAVAQGISGVLQGMVAKYRDRSPDATDPAIESARMKLAKEFKALFDLTNFPERTVPGARNPKFDQLVEIIDERVGQGRRTLIFTDSPALAESATKMLSERFPVHLHAECLSGAILVWQSGRTVQTYRPKAYVDGNKTWAARDWATYVLSRVISANPDFLSCTLTQGYNKGQNLQAFDTVVHLDRDAWNSETMKQRTARAWRTGQDHAVDEIILDAVYANPDGDKDETLDQIAGHLQHLEADLFDRVIIESQSEALGKEWFGMRRLHSSFIELNRRVMELAMSPYARRVGQVQGSGIGV